MCHEVKIWVVSLEQSLDWDYSTHLLEFGTGVWLPAFTTFELHPFDSESFLFSTEIPCAGVLGHVGKEDETEESDGQRYYAIYEEEPLCRGLDHCHAYGSANTHLPPSESAFAFEIVNSSHQISAKHACNGTGCMEDAASLGQLVFAIPGSDEVLHARVEATLSQAH